MSTTDCPPLAERVTKSLLGYGVIAGPIYVLVAVVQVFMREGFDPTRHVVSQLAVGELGWIQIANFVITGALTIAGAVGIARALAPSRHARWAGALLAGYGAGMIAAGCLRADASDGFPPGTPPGAGSMSWHGMGHFVAGGLGFVCFVGASFVIATWFSRQGLTGWAWYSRITATAFAVAFALMASGSTGAAGILLFTAAVVAGWAWLSIVSVKLHQAVGASRR